MSDHSHDAGGHHITSPQTLIATFLALVALTVLTSVLADPNVSEVINFGRGEIWVVLAIATVKAALVATIFMHLLHDKAFNGIILMGTMLFVCLFIGFTLMDTKSYAPGVEAYSQDVLQQQAESATP